MTNRFRLRGRLARAAFRCVPPATPAAAIAQGRATSSSPISNAAGASTPPSCAPRWRPPSAAPTPTAPGTGRPPTTPARRPRSCSCANSAGACAHAPASPAAMLPMLAKIAGLLPTHTRRSEESQALQQFSTPIPLGFAASAAAAITPADSCWSLRPAPACSPSSPSSPARSLVLNELAETRAGTARPSLSRRRRHALRRRAYRRSSRRRRSRRASC